MKRILVAFDDTPGADAAMRDMVRGGFPEKCEAQVLAIADVWLPPEAAASEPVFPDRVSGSRVAARENALAALAAAREIAVRGAERVHALFPGWTVHHRAHADSPAWGILAEARKWPADLVVIGSHGRSPLQKFFLGSVSYKVAAEATCSVRVFKAHAGTSDRSARVLVAVDGSTDSQAAVQEVLSRNWPAETKFQLVTVIDHRAQTYAIGDAGAFPPDSEQKVEDALRAMLAKDSELFRERGYGVSAHALQGDPKAMLLHHADSWQADCVFLGARGLQHGGRLYLGTFASAIVTRAHCTVEIVRSPPAMS